jgi:hypothetical protein
MFEPACMSRRTLPADNSCCKRHRRMRRFPRFLLHIKKLLDSTHEAIKFFFSSRPNVQVLSTFPNSEKLDLDSTTGLTADDIETYARTQVKDRDTLQLGTRLLNGKQPALEDWLIAILTRRSQGM